MLSFYDLSQKIEVEDVEKIKKMDIKNPNISGNWELKPIDFLEIGIRADSNPYISSNSVIK